MPYKDPKKAKEIRAKYYQAHKKHMLALSKKWRKDHPERTKLIQAKWDQSKKGKLSIKRAQAKFGKTEKAKLNQKRWHQSPKGKRYLLKNRLDKYGLTILEYERMRKKQKDQCAICGKLGGKTLCVDHDHRTGNARGLICQSCNHLLGDAFDNVDILLSAIQYLRKHQIVENEKGIG